MKIAIFHNLSPDAGFGLNCILTRDGKRYEPRSHELVRVFEFDSAGLPDPGEIRPTVIADLLFRAFNVGHEPGYAESTAERELAIAYRERRLRSFSVGDVVLLGDRQYLSCESVCWAAIEGSELNIITGAAAAEALIRERYGFRPGEELSVSVPLREEGAGSHG